MAGEGQLQLETSADGYLLVNVGKGPIFVNAATINYRTECQLEVAFVGAPASEQRMLLAEQLLMELDRVRASGLRRPADQGIGGADDLVMEIMLEGYSGIVRRYSREDDMWLQVGDVLPVVTNLSPCSASRLIHLDVNTDEGIVAFDAN